MMILKTRLDHYRKSHGAVWEIIEQDYVLSWILAGIFSVPYLKHNLAFKGGTCLRKCYFGDYRFSQDIDFTVLARAEDLKEDLFIEIQKAVLLARDKVRAMGENFYMDCYVYQEKEPHPEGQQAFLIKAQFPWQKEPLTRIYVEVTFAEDVILGVKTKPIIHPYDQEFDYEINVYDIHEIIAEKIRALLQFSKKLHERGWARSRVRDYYDLWRLFTDYKAQINHDILRDIVPRKCQNKNIIFENGQALFNERLMHHVEKEWEIWLKGIVIGNLPHQNEVIGLLKSELLRIFP